MTPNLSLTDPTTWIGVLTLVAAVASDVFHRSFAAYVPAAATIAAGVVVAVILLSKHHLAAAVTSAAGTAAVVPDQLPPSVSSRIRNLIDASSELATLGTHLLTQPAAQTTSTGPAAPAAPTTPASPVAAPVAPVSAPPTV